MSITLPDGITTINDYTFSDCQNLMSVKIPSSVTSIGTYAFEDCSSLTSIVIPSSVTSIGNYAFRYCYKLVEVYNLSSLDIRAGNSSNGYVGYYADYIYTSLDTSLKQQKVGDYVFYFDNGIMYLLSYTGNSENLNLPSIEDVKKVFDEFTGSTYQIYQNAFYNNDNITGVTIPSAVEVIGYSAFNDCDNLTSITIPSGVESIGNNAFYSCNGLTSVTFADNSSLVSIGSSAFNNCNSLTSIKIPSSVTSIGSSAFSYCSSLASVTFEDNSSLVSIENSAFYYCTNLTSITIPSNVTSIGSSAFYYCTNLTSITIPSNVTSIGSSAFRYCYKLVEIINLSRLSIWTGSSSSNGYIGYYADYVYKSLDTPLIQQKVGDYIFYLNNGTMYLLSYTGSDTNLILPSVDEIKTKYTNFSGDTYQIYEYAFYNNDNITSVIIPSTVTSIGSYAFYGCGSLTSVTFEEESQLESIGSYAFESCGSLIFIIIPSTVTSIGSYAFRYCYDLTIYFEVERQPSGWGSSWNDSDRPVYWGLNKNWEYDEVTGEPTPIE